MIINKFNSKATALLFLLAFFTLFSSFPVGADNEKEAEICPSSSKAYAVYMYNIDKDASVFEKNIDRKISPASTVKLMTAMVAFDNISDIEKDVIITDQMIRSSYGNIMKLQLGEKIEISHLFAALVCGGYNDAATALATIACGSEDRFVSKMNEKATSLGATNTFYKDPTGISDSAQTTAYDTMLISKEFMKYTFLYELSQIPVYHMPNTNLSESRDIHNRNALISNRTGPRYLNSNAMGMNAGMTSGGGYCIVTSMKQEDITYICVVMGGEYDENSQTTYSYVIANELLNYVNRSLSYQTILEAGTAVASLPIVGADMKKDSISLAPSKDVRVYLPSDFKESNAVKLSYIYFKDSLIAPIDKGQIVGKIVVRYHDDIVAVEDIVTAEDVTRNSFIYSMEIVRNFLFSRTFIAGASFFISTIALYLYIGSRRYSLKRKRKNIKMYKY